MVDFILQTAAEDLINGLEEYIAESFVRTTFQTHKFKFLQTATVPLVYCAVCWVSSDGD